MGDISPGYLFAPSEGRGQLNSIKLNAAGNGATINPSFVSSKPAVSSVTSADQLLLLKADGTYARVPATAVGTGGGGGGGDMFKAVYDANNNNIVDAAESVPWTGVTGKPAIGDMTKAVYDTNGNGVVDTADAIAWTAVTGKPATFPPDATAELAAHKGVASGYAGLDTTGKVPTAQLPAFGTGDMLKSVYDTNNNGIVDNAESANAVAWTGVTGKPAAFTPSAHGTTHLDNGTDPVPVATASRTGLAPVLSGNATTFLNGTGVYSTPVGVTPAAHASTHITGGSDVIPAPTVSASGLCPAIPGNTTTFLRGDGTFAAVPGGGDMLKSTYDTNSNGVVDTCDSLAWSKLTGLPAGNLVDPGTWTALSLGTGWTAPTQAQYRIETNGTVKTVFFRGMIQGAWSVIGTTAFTLPAAAFPSMTRSAVLAGAQNTGTASDVASYVVSVSSAGVAIIYFLAASAFVWADHSQTQQIYLDGLSFSL